MAKSTNYRGIHISIRYEYGYDYYEIREINKGKKWNDVTLFSTLKEAKQYIDEHYDELVELCNVKESKSSARKSIKESKVMTFEEFKKLCNDNFGYAIMDFNEYKGAYIVVISADEKATEKFAKILGKHGFEYTFYKLQNPNSEYYLCYEIMCV